MYQDPKKTSSPTVLLTETENTQLDQWLQHDASSQELRAVIHKVCETCPQFAKLVFVGSRFGSSEAKNDDPSPLKTVMVKEPSTSKNVSCPANPGIIANGDENFVPTKSSPNSEEVVAMASDISSESVQPNDQLTIAAGRNAMSLTTMLQSSPASLDWSSNTLSTPLVRTSNKKRKLEHQSSRHLAICKLCGCPYDVERDSEKLCIFHAGCLEADEEAEYMNESSDISDSELKFEEPEAYLWSCCGKRGDELGCQQGHHNIHFRQTEYAELKHREAYSSHRYVGNQQSDS